MSTFLIADDNDAKALMLEAFVRKWGYADTILRASTTEEAKQLIDNNDIAYAFIDYEMPTENGPAVIAYIKAKYPDCHIAMASSSNSDTYRNDAAEAGAEDYICTSFDEETVQEAIETVLITWE